MLAAQAQQRRRAEQVRAGEPVAQLLERAQRVGLLRPGDDDAHEMPERRIRERAIEDALEQHERQLGDRWQTLAEELEDPAEFAAAWRELAGNWSFAQVNELIERHNRNFPAEARLAMDPRTRDFVRINGRSYLREPLGADWILERWPADLERLRVDVDDGA